MGAYIVQGRIEVSLYINNIEFPLDTMNVLGFLHVGWSSKLLLPTFHMSLSDVQHVLDQVELQDGVPIRIVVKPYSAPTVTYNFRKFHHRKQFNGNCFIYEMDGYLDVVKYWTGTSLAGLRGTSDDILSQVSQICGLQYNGSVSTNDSQLWMQRNRTYGEFAADIAWRGYVSDSSFMRIGVDPRGILIYRDVNNLPDPQTTIVLGQYINGCFTAVDYEPQAKSGLNNKMVGYKNTRNDQSLTADEMATAYSQLSFTPDSKSPLINLAVRNAMGNGYQSFGGIDMGNTHDNYERALYQNLRFANLYSLDVEFLIQTPTNLTLFDTFTFSVDQESNKQDAAYAGTYIVAAKAFLVQGATYAEKLLGVRQGTNLNYTSG
jgi:hypothetical protein